MGHGYSFYGLSDYLPGGSCQTSLQKRATGARARPGKVDEATSRSVFETASLVAATSVDLRTDAERFWHRRRHRLCCRLPAKHSRYARRNALCVQLNNDGNLIANVGA